MSSLRYTFFWAVDSRSPRSWTPADLWFPHILGFSDPGLLIFWALQAHILNSPRYLASTNLGSPSSWVFPDLAFLHILALATIMGLSRSSVPQIMASLIFLGSPRPRASPKSWAPPDHGLSYVVCFPWSWAPPNFGSLQRKPGGSGSKCKTQGLLSAILKKILLYAPPPRYSSVLLY